MLNSEIISMVLMILADWHQELQHSPSKSLPTKLRTFPITASGYVIYTLTVTSVPSLQHHEVLKLSRSRRYKDYCLLITSILVYYHFVLASLNFNQNYNWREEKVVSGSHSRETEGGYLRKDCLIAWEKFPWVRRNNPPPSSEGTWQYLGCQLFFNLLDL